MNVINKQRRENDLLVLRNNIILKTNVAECKTCVIFFLMMLEEVTKLTTLRGFFSHGNPIGKKKYLNKSKEREKEKTFIESK